MTVCRYVRAHVCNNKQLCCWLHTNVVFVARATNAAVVRYIMRLTLYISVRIYEDD